MQSFIDVFLNELIRLKASLIKLSTIVLSLIHHLAVVLARLLVLVARVGETGVGGALVFASAAAFGFFTYAVFVEDVDFLAAYRPLSLAGDLDVCCETL